MKELVSKRVVKKKFGSGRIDYSVELDMAHKIGPFEIGRKTCTDDIHFNESSDCEDYCKYAINKSEEVFNEDHLVIRRLYTSLCHDLNELNRVYSKYLVSKGGNKDDDFYALYAVFYYEDCDHTRFYKADGFDQMKYIVGSYEYIDHEIRYTFSYPGPFPLKERLCNTLGELQQKAAIHKLIEYYKNLLLDDVVVDSESYESGDFSSEEIVKQKKAELQRAINEKELKGLQEERNKILLQEIERTDQYKQYLVSLLKH